MGFAIAAELARHGARVTLVAGPTKEEISHPNIARHNVVSANEMHGLCMQLFEKMDGAVMAAAVADFKPVNPRAGKMKDKKEQVVLELSPTTDIAASLGKIKKKNQLLVGFALETENEIENAKGKLNKKNLDFIVLNSLKDAGAGFHFDTNKITIIDKDNKIINHELKSKQEAATDVVAKIIEGFGGKGG
jgi:phosphopantothenoylcysteine decarboxylase/phosphopantothenate--cysteine ligase